MADVSRALVPILKDGVPHLEWQAVKGRLYDFYRDRRVTDNQQKGFMNFYSGGQEDMHVPKWAIALNFVTFILVASWAAALSWDRNPLPWPDPGSRIFSASSPEGKAAIVEMLASNGVKERFQANSSGIMRSIMWDGTIINYSPAEFTHKIGMASSSIGLVSDDPNQSAQEAARFLQSKGFQAEVVAELEPNLPIYFVVTDAMVGTVINFRPPIAEMPAPE